MITSAQTSCEAPAASALVAVMVEPGEVQSVPLLERKLTDQPPGRAGGVTPATFVAAKVVVRLYVSAIAPLLRIQTRNREVVEAPTAGVTALSLMIAVVAAPSP